MGTRLGEAVVPKPLQPRSEWRDTVRAQPTGGQFVLYSILSVLYPHAFVGGGQSRFLECLHKIRLHCQQRWQWRCVCRLCAPCAPCMLFVWRLYAHVPGRSHALVVIRYHRCLYGCSVRVMPASSELSSTLIVIRNQLIIQFQWRRRQHRRRWSAPSANLLRGAKGHQRRQTEKRPTGFALSCIQGIF